MAREALFSDPFLRRIERLALAAKRAEGGGGRGEAGKGGRLEFSDHRAYVPGDDLRYLDWHLYGRLGRLYLKEFAREKQADVVLVLDTSASMAMKLRGAIRFSAALLVVALARGDRARFATASGGRLRLSRPLEGAGRRSELLAQLEAADGTAGGGTDLDRSLAGLPPVTGAGRRLTLVVSDLLAAGDGRRALSGRSGDTTVFHWLAPGDRDPGPLGRVRLVDAEGGEIAAWVGPEEAARYAREAEEWVAGLAADFSRHGIRYLVTPAERETEDLVMGLLVGEGVLR